MVAITDAVLNAGIATDFVVIFVAVVDVVISVTCADVFSAFVLFVVAALCLPISADVTWLLLLLLLVFLLLLLFYVRPSDILQSIEGQTACHLVYQS